jgi:hypothetical protein
VAFFFFFVKEVLFEIIYGFEKGTAVREGSIQNPLSRETNLCFGVSTGFRLGHARLCWSCLRICPTGHLNLPL